MTAQFHPEQHPSQGIQAEVLLQRYLSADDRQSEILVEQLIHEYVDPLAMIIIRRELGVNMRRPLKQQGIREENALDIHGQILLSIYQQLNRWRKGERLPPDKFLNYVAVVASHACKKGYSRSLLDSRFKVYTLLTREKGLALWHEEGGLRIGGYTQWREAGLEEASAAIRDALLRDPEGFALAGLHRRSPGKKLRDCTFREWMRALLDQAGAPLDFSTLVTAFSALASALEPPIREISITEVEKEGEEARDMLQTELKADIDIEKETVDAASQRDLWRQLWPQIVQLPLNQRVALLLNFPGADIRLLPEMGIASFAEITAALERFQEALARQWKFLPLDDTVIAHELGLTEAQVKNLRQSASRTLSWRMRPFSRGSLNRLWRAAIQLDPPRPAVYMLYVRDQKGASLLKLLPREGYANRDTISRELQLPPLMSERVWDQLPLRFHQIADLLQKPIPVVVRLYDEARTQLRASVTNMKLTDET
ncbi:MAG TPA: hypothetical protein VKU00_04310 [Chthonomonadaceae bacterium]|nr:hypothetical protein [Chthonomonadaceae bacterium]